MVTLDEFKVSMVSGQNKCKLVETTIDQLASDSTAKEMIRQALEVRHLCDNPFVYLGMPIVPRKVEVIIDKLEGSLYIQGINLEYTNSRTRQTEKKYLDYADFVAIAETKKK